MSSLRRDLFERRLWPLALLLLAAIVAVPFVLHGHADASAVVVPSAPSPAPAATDGSSDPATTGTQNASEVGAGGQSARTVSAVVIRRELRRRVLRDPFASGAQKLTRTPTHISSSSSSSTPASPSPGGPGTTDSSAPSQPSETTGTTVTPAPTTDTAPASATTGGAGAGAAASAPAGETTTMTVTTTATETATTPTSATTTTTDQPPGAGPWTIYSVDVRMGVPGHFAARTDLARLTPLPSVATPKAMFTGVLDHGHEAVFALGSGVDAIGPGVCRPDRKNCSAIALKPGQSERLTYLGPAGEIRTFVLSVSHVAAHLTSSRSTALSAYQRYSQAGQCELDLADPVQYDPASGSVSDDSRTECRRVAGAVPFPGALNGS